MTKSRVRLGISIALFCVGSVLFGGGIYLETRNPRTGEEDIVAWCVLGIGVAMVSVGASLPFVPVWAVVPIGIASPFVAFVLAVIAVWALIMLNAIFRFGL